MPRVIYFDCFTGISGDMILGALVAAGADFDILKKELDKLKLHGWDIKKSKKIINSINRTDVEVGVHEHSSSHHEKSDTHKHTHHHHHRNLKDIKNIITKSKLKDSVKQLVIKIFETLAIAEARVHGTTVDEIHFHEVGAVDAIVDITGAAIALELLGIEKIYASAIPVASGFVKTMHGVMPVPPPAVTQMLKGVLTVASPITTETVTPTGLAILKGAGATFGEMPAMLMEEIGYGAGKKDLTPYPNILRVIIGNINDEKEGILSDTVDVIETNTDNVAGEELGNVMNILFEAGALDVYFTPIYMKKNRPGQKLSVICYIKSTYTIAKLIFENINTIGLRITRTPRIKLKRTAMVFTSKFGPVKVKKTGLHIYPEKVCQYHRE